MKWEPIETAPKDGTIVKTRRIHKGKIVHEGKGRWRSPHPNAPQCLVCKGSATCASRHLIVPHHETINSSAHSSILAISEP